MHHQTLTTAERLNRFIVYSSTFIVRSLMNRSLPEASGLGMIVSVRSPSYPLSFHLSPFTPYTLPPHVLPLTFHVSRLPAVALAKAGLPILSNTSSEYKTALPRSGGKNTDPSSMNLH